MSRSRNSIRIGGIDSAAITLPTHFKDACLIDTPRNFRINGAVIDFLHETLRHIRNASIRSMMMETTTLPKPISPRSIPLWGIRLGVSVRKGRWKESVECRKVCNREWCRVRQRLHNTIPVSAIHPTIPHMFFLKSVIKPLQSRCPEISGKFV